MTDYFIIVNIILDALNGKNLNNSFNLHIKQSKNVANIAKIKDISYGLLRNYYIVNAILNHLINKEPEVKVKVILLIGLYELKFTKKPDFAVTNEIVNLTYKLLHKPQLKNFANAVLRNYLRKVEEFDLILNAQEEYKLNAPQWLINKLKLDYPDQYKEILFNLNLKPKLGIRINLNKIALTNYVSKLNDNSINYKIIDNKIVLVDTLPVENIPGFNDGEVSIQDINAQKLVDLIKLKPGDTVLDACSAPGGKLCQILENYSVNIIGLDIDKERLNKIQENLSRLDLKANLLVADARNLKWWNGKLFDTVIADVPCSASGTIKRNPDIKLQRRLDDIELFVKTQRQIIQNLWQTVKSGGVLVYITCSIFKEENLLNIQYFIDKFKDMRIEKELVLLPSEIADGFFYCVLRKQD